MTNLEQRYLETVPAALRRIGDILEQILTMMKEQGSDAKGTGGTDPGKRQDGGL